MFKVILVVFLALVSSAVMAADLQLIHTTGVAEKYVDPNMVIISVEAYGQAEFAKAAQEKQAAEYQRVKAVVDKFKIKKEEFLTENLSLTPQYRYDEKTQMNKTIGFKASHQIKIILKQKNDAGAFLDTISSGNKSDKSGVIINSIAWDNDSRKSISENLISEAVADARSKADRLASAAGVKIKAVQTIAYSEAADTTTNYPVAARMAFKSASSGGAATELGSGQIKVRTEVSLQYRIE